MFNDEPFIAAGAKFSCTGTDGHISPFYLRVEGEPDFNSETNVVTLAVRPSHFTEMIYGHAHLEQGMAENGIPAEAAGQAGQNSTGARRTGTELPLGSSPAKILPPEGCVYSVQCAALITLLADDECPSSHPYANVLSLSRVYDDSGDYRASGGNYDMSDSEHDGSGTATCTDLSVCTPSIPEVCTPGIPEVCTPQICPPQICVPYIGFRRRSSSCYQPPCTPQVCTPSIPEICTPSIPEICTPGPDRYRYHCCDETHKNKLHFGYEKEMEYNMNYDKTTQSSVEETHYMNGMFTLDNYAYLSLKAVVDVDIAAAQFDILPGFLDKALIPTGINKVDAYLEGTADMQVRAVMNAGTYTYGTMLGPLEVMAKTDVADIQFMLGIFPVKLKLAFGMHFVLEAQIQATLPYPLEIYSKASGYVKYGGLYDGQDFQKHDIREFNYTYKKPDLTQALKDVEVSGTITATVTPTVYVTFYDLVPFDFQFNAYAGVDFTKYSAQRIYSSVHE